MTNTAASTGYPMIPALLYTYRSVLVEVATIDGERGAIHADGPHGSPERDLPDPKDSQTDRHATICGSSSIMLCPAHTE